MSGQHQQLGFVIDLKRCIGCDTCVVGCKMEHATPPGEFRLKVFDSQGNFQVEKPEGDYPQLGMYWIPTMCHNCTDAPCVSACPTRALWTREADGVVALDTDKCVGCQRCGEECPYDALWFDPVTGKADKCNLCEHRLAEGAGPLCELVCPTRAIHFGDLNDPGSRVSRLLRERENQRLHEASGARPNIFYLAP
ncbi:MAG: 4Fe-4S dicluster domain-containing protein [Pseudomonadales bacterium]|nr:4Fe-4S dicluster domain-containing protein [Halioglobus sp.]MCP5190643.1 4Fe-4S dicluster domain-containing protein [Pseudomonadales bacterium]